MWYLCAFPNHIEKIVENANFPLRYDFRECLKECIDRLYQIDPRKVLNSADEGIELVNNLLLYYAVPLVCEKITYYPKHSSLGLFLVPRKPKSSFQEVKNA
jgi:hypothetical protein